MTRPGTIVPTTALGRRRLSVSGIVQGVGFRPFVYGLALRHGLGGYVRNDSTGVTIEVEGTTNALAAFQHCFHAELPPLARVDAVTVEPLPPLGATAFVIDHSRAGNERATLISPDVATCDDCLRELVNPADRRYRYPFINCTNCGPRFTIVQDVPYDREMTTMRHFPMCDACLAEYTDPLNRRFHAQPNACPVCGPAVELRLAQDGARALVGEDTIHQAATALAAGAILAIKGLGGYHLACDAANQGAVGRLRASKQREAKPFALMVRDLQAARGLCEIGEDEATILESRRRPIVLLTRQANAPIAGAVAPGYDSLGIMLPYTPLHHLLLDDFARLTPGAVPALVMTSGNLSDEPIAHRDDEAHERLGPLANGALPHNRPIHVRCDDSVVQVVNREAQLLRRSRGYVPEPIALAGRFPLPLLACGGHLKNTFCLGKGNQAFLSHHIGDLENLETLLSFTEGIEHFQRLFDIYPEAVAYDLHPGYLATQYALDLDLPVKVGVQHHHAHIASVMAEHGLAEPVIGVAADGTGYGTDDAIWGCEVMVTDLSAFERVAHLVYVPLPGGEQAIRQPWRMAAVYLARAFGEDFVALDIPFTRRLDRARWRPLAQMMERELNSPPTSSLGRLFDAVAALLGARDVVDYEGQAAIELEIAAKRAEPDRSLQPYTFSISDGSPSILDVLPVIREIAQDIQRGVDWEMIALRFHHTVAEMLAAACGRVREQHGLNRVALSGGVFQNRLLLEQLLARLQELSFQIYTNRLVPPNDGGLSLGQAAVAAAHLRSRRS